MPSAYLPKTRLRVLQDPVNGLSHRLRHGIRHRLFDLEPVQRLRIYRRWRQENRLGAYPVR